MNAQNAAAAAPTTGVVPAAADEVSALTAAQFAAHAQMYQAVSAQAAAIHEQFVNTLTTSSGSYAATEAANAAAPADRFDGLRLRRIHTDVRVTASPVTVGLRRLERRSSGSTSALTALEGPRGRWLTEGGIMLQYPVPTVAPHRVTDPAITVHHDKICESAYKRRQATWQHVL